MRLPVLKSARLHAFSLYDTMPVIETDFNDSISCLVGANGLGKSTFLSAILFALTGRVAEPGRDVIDSSVYFRDTLPFTEDYFRGRVSELDYDRAYVEVVLSLGGVSLLVRRSIKSPDELDALSIDGEQRHPTESKSLLHQFNEQVLESAAVSSVEQFTVLVHFLMNFDESRRLLFWEPRLIEPILFLAFGASPEIALEAGRLRASADKLNSRARNTRWQASSVRTRISELESSPKPEAVETEQTRAGSDRNRLKELMDAHHRTGEEADLVRQRLSDAHARLGLAAANKRDAERTLESAFTEAFSGRKDWRDHVLIRESMHDHVCALCGTPADLEMRLRDVGNCILCGTTTVQSASPSVPDLSGVRAKIDQSETAIVDAEHEVKRLTSALEEALVQLTVLEENISAFQLEERVAVSRAFSGPDSTLDFALQAARENFKSLTAEADEYVRERDAVRKKLRPLVAQLEDAFRNAQRRFVPIFQELAESFIGRELDIEITSSPSKPVSLQLRLEGSTRDRPTQLSESQRFFLDIALRMALIRYAGDDGGTLLVDTPEGSLDVAYEARAGEMFSNFARGEGQILMTSNLNGSRLLRRIASSSGRHGLKLERMTEWATLSEVQLNGADLFDEAFEAIVSEFETA